MKVVLATRAVFPFHGYGGMETYVYFLSKHLLENGVDVEIVTSSSKKEVNADINLNYTFLPPFVSGKFTQPVRYWLFVRNCAKYLNKLDFDILHACGITAYRYLKFGNRKPVVAQPFGSEEFKNINEGKLVGRVYSDFFMRKPKIYCMQHADAIASEGELQTKEIMDLFKVPREKIFALPDGVDMDLVEQYLEKTKITKEDFNLQDADLVLMNVNRLEPNKGVLYLIDALRILNEELKVKLILVGTGSQKQEIKERIEKLGLKDKVLHFENIPDKKMFQLYTLADISVTPTLYEGLPLVILEAMATEKTIVASDVSEVPQVVKNKENGFLVPPASPKAIADAVIKIYDKNLFEKMGRKSKEIAKDYDWDIIANMAIKKYEELV